MRRLGHLTYREYANVILFVQDWLTWGAAMPASGASVLAMLRDAGHRVVPVVPGPEILEPPETPGLSGDLKVSAERLRVSVERLRRLRAVESYLRHGWLIDPNGRFWHDGGR